MRTAVLAALFMAVAASATYAADGDNAASLPGEIKGSSHDNPSYFEGVWVGTWPGGGPTTPQDVTVKIQKGNTEGVFFVDYSWSAATIRRVPVLPGSIRTRGNEEGDRFVFKFTNKQGRTFEFTLRKHTDNMVKARMEKSGPSEPQERSFGEISLNRK